MEAPFFMLCVVFSRRQTAARRDFPRLPGLLNTTPALLAAGAGGGTEARGSGAGRARGGAAEGVRPARLFKKLYQQPKRADSRDKNAAVKAKNRRNTGCILSFFDLTAAFSAAEISAGAIGTASKRILGCSPRIFGSAGDFFIFCCICCCVFLAVWAEG